MVNLTDPNPAGRDARRRLGSLRSRRDTSNFPTKAASRRFVKSPKTYVILLLAVTTVGGAILAWRQYSELVELRSAAMNRDERSDLQRRLWDLEKLNRDLQAQLAALRGPNDVDGVVSGNADGEGPPRGGRGG